MNHFSKKHLEKVLFSLDVQMRTTLDDKTHRTSITRRTVQLTSLRLCSGHVIVCCYMLHCRPGSTPHITYAAWILLVAYSYCFAMSVYDAYNVILPQMPVVFLT